MKPIHVLVLLSGVVPEKDKVSIGTGFVRAFEDMGYQFGGEILYLTESKYVAFPQINLYGPSSTPTAWILGLNSKDWYEDKLTSLGQQLLDEAGVHLLMLGNFGA